MAVLLILLVYVLSIIESARVMYEKKVSAWRWALFAFLNLSVFALAYWNIWLGLQADAKNINTYEWALPLFGVVGLAMFGYNVYLFLGGDKESKKKV